MTKAELKEKWSKYCNVDKLFDGAEALLKKHNHLYSEHGICTMLDTSISQKEDMIKMFVTSPNYIGDLRIVVQKEFERQISSDELQTFFCDIQVKLHTKEMYKYKDDQDKSLVDYLLVGKNVIDLDGLPNDKEQKEKLKKTAGFNYTTMATSESLARENEFLKYMNAFRCMPYTKLNKNICVPSKNDLPNLRHGTKTSRAFNKVCQFYGVDKFCPTTVESTDENGNVTKRTVYPYDKVFAAYSDLVSDLKRKMYFVISLNPLDYLTMSFGVSWVSCHNISHGGYMGGCLSYMLDNTSIITYVVNELSEPLHDVPKFYRQMVHYDNGMFVQNRLYPQGNDGATNLYDKFRGFVIEEFAKMLHEDGDWDVEVGVRPCKAHIASYGTHYRDYHYNNSCNIFYPKTSKEKIRAHIMKIGHEGICTKCGKPYSYSGALSHHRNDRECKL